MHQKVLQRSLLPMIPRTSSLVALVYMSDDMNTWGTGDQRTHNPGSPATVHGQEIWHEESLSSGLVVLLKIGDRSEQVDADSRAVTIAMRNLSVFLSRLSVLAKR